MADSLPELLESFNAAFIVPIASHEWASRRGRSHWVDLEGWHDSLAGPLYAIAHGRGCEYVYSLDDHYFSGVTEPNSLRRRLLEFHAGLTAGVEKFVAQLPTEETDLAFMRSTVAGMRDVLERAWLVELAHWEPSVRRQVVE
jgi:hypothetical protein